MGEPVQWIVVVKVELVAFGDAGIPEGHSVHEGVVRVGLALYQTVGTGGFLESAEAVIIEHEILFDRVVSGIDGLDRAGSVDAEEGRVPGGLFGEVTVERVVGARLAGLRKGGVRRRGGGGDSELVEWVIEAGRDEEIVGLRALVGHLNLRDGPAERVGDCNTCPAEKNSIGVLAEGGFGPDPETAIEKA